MSFAEQERALFDLVFSAELRGRFAADRQAALADYALEREELADFERVRAAALDMDAALRASMVLSQLCISFPVTFTLISALGELDLLPELIDPALMRVAPAERAGAFGQQLRRRLAGDADALPHGHEIVAVLDAELGMAVTAAALRQVAPEATATQADLQLPDDWSTRALKVADYVSASVLPGAYSRLKSELCQVGDRALHRHLTQHPVTAERVQATLADNEPHVLIARAWIDQASKCDPTTRHEIMELSEGFAIMLQHVNGANSADDLLGHLADAGAEPALLDGVRSGFRQMVAARMLTLA